jgi:very-short-patch-repair endonuclease
MTRINNNPKLKSRRKELRSHLSPAEAILWNQLKNSKLGTKFRRQHSIGPFILDNYCPHFKLGIELDGETHNNEKSFDYDLNRTRFLNQQGIKIIRFLNIDIYKNLEGVLLEIKKHLK